MKTTSILLFLLVITGSLYAQDRTIRAMVPPGRKVYLEQTFSQMEVINRQNNMKFKQDRSLTIRVTGPATIQPGRKDRFELEFIPEGGLAASEAESQYVIKDFKASFVSSSGFIDFVDSPVYEAIVDRQTHTLSTIDEFIRMGRQGAGAFLSLVAQSIGPQALFMGTAGLLGKAFDWLTAVNEPDYLKIWSETFQNDQFAIPYPTGTTPGGNFSWLQVTCPFVQNIPNGKLTLRIDHISIMKRGASSGNQMISDYFLTDLEYVLVTAGQIARPGKIDLAKTIQMQPIKIKTPGNAEIGLSATLIPRHNGNVLQVKLQPDQNIYSDYQFEKMQLALVSPRHTMLVNGLPVINNQKNEKFNQVSLRQQKRDDFFNSLLLFGLSSLSKASGVQEINNLGQSVSAAYKLNENAEVLFSENFAKNSFSDIVKNQWESEREKDLFLLPVFGKRTLYTARILEEITIEIPFQSFKDQVPDMTLLVVADIQAIKKGSTNPLRFKEFLAANLNPVMEAGHIVELMYWRDHENKFLLNKSPMNQISEKESFKAFFTEPFIDISVNDHRGEITLERTGLGLRPQRFPIGKNKYLIDDDKIVYYAPGFGYLMLWHTHAGGDGMSDRRYEFTAIWFDEDGNYLMAGAGESLSSNRKWTTSGIKNINQSPVHKPENKLQSNTGILKIKVINTAQYPVNNAIVHISDSYHIQQVSTNASGMAELEVTQGQKLFIAAYIPGSNKSSIGVAAIKHTTQSQDRTVIIPPAPSNSFDATMQLDNMVNVWAAAYDLYTFIDLERVMRSGSPEILVKSGGLGIPDIFSILPVPLKNNPGQLGLLVTGRLAEIFTPFPSMLSPNYLVPYCVKTPCEF